MDPTPQNGAPKAVEQLMKWSLALATWMHSPSLCPKSFGVEVVGQMSCRVGPRPDHLPTSSLPAGLNRRVLIMFHGFTLLQWVSLWNILEPCPGHFPALLRYI